MSREHTGAGAEAAHDCGPPTSLARALLADGVGAAVTSLLVSPFVTAIDKAVIHLACGRATSLSSEFANELAGYMTHPRRMLSCPGFRMVYGLYLATYTAVNVVDTACARRGYDAALPKAAAAAVVNLPLSILQDRRFMRVFGTGKPRELPLATYALFATRDAGTMIAAFTMPPLLAAAMSSSSSSSLTLSPAAATTTTQLVCPVAMQCVTSPLHIVGLDLYNHPGSAPLKARLAFVRALYARTTAARIGRIGPAFSIGGVSNNLVRSMVAGPAASAR